jgi:hypothetical protein
MCLVSGGWGELECYKLLAITVVSKLVTYSWLVGVGLGISICR